MLFNSYLFLFAFLPLTLIGFYGLGKSSNKQAAIVWLVLASLFFYGWWSPAYLILILASMLFNYAVGICLARSVIYRKMTCTLGVIANLSLLAYYKYANFFVDNLNALTGSDIVLTKVILPLAISFFTFQQIAYLIDAYKEKVKEHRFWDYCLFVTFFPQLIAGPIVHHQEMLPQFQRKGLFDFMPRNFSIGFTIFFIGLFKKVVLADNIAPFGTSVFEAAEFGVSLTMLEAWMGALAYTLQLYFDFSGYSDMAIGLARLFGIRLPINFNSPYKSKNIIEFWRRWHMTLSRFLRDYVYIPLGGNRLGSFNRYRNLIITMLLGGLWHGAAWNFVIWGGLHGLFLVINQWFIKLRLSHFGLGRPITLVAIVVAWIFFRATDFNAAMLLLKSMFGFNGFDLPYFMKPYLENALSFTQLTFSGEYANAGRLWPKAGSMLVLLLGLVWFFPNTQELTKRYRPTLSVIKSSNLLIWRPTMPWAVIISLMALLSILHFMTISEFLYYQF